MDRCHLAHLDNGNADGQQKDLQHVPRVNDTDDLVSQRPGLLPSRPVNRRGKKQQPDDFQSGRKNAGAKDQARYEVLLAFEEGLYSFDDRRLGMNTMVLDGNDGV